MAEDNQKISMGMGIVSQNALYGKERSIFVVPIDQIPNIKGKLEFVPYEIKTQGKDSQGKEYIDTINSQTSITAHWYGNGDNRITPPQVRVSEKVELFRFKGDEKVYFRTFNANMHLRHQETMIEAFAAKPTDLSTEVVETTPYNSYSRTVDGTNGLIEYRMATANGEISPWLFQMNGKTGLLTITDQKNNVIEINTATTIINLKNADGSKIEMNKRVISMYAPDKIDIKADNQINIETNELNVKCQTYKEECNSHTMKASNVQFDISGGFVVNCPKSTFNGQVSMGGFDTAAGGGSGGGSVKGSLSVQGPVKLNGGTSNGRINGS